MSSPQSYATHRRYFPIYHYVASPLLLAYLGYQTVALVRAPSVGSLFEWAFALGVFFLAFAARLMALKAQDRVIRLEMRLRLAEVLPEELRPRVRELRAGQLIALRFAPDAELPGLVRRILEGELVKGDAIKKEIRDWQADHFRV